MTQVLIAGGYGTVGGQVAQLLAERHPGFELLLGGRNPSGGERLAATLPHARALHLDLKADDPLEGIGVSPDVVLMAVNDPADRLLVSALRRGVPLVDITRWTERMRDALLLAAAEAPRAPLVLASSWMAAVPATLAREAASAFGALSRIDVDVLYALKDRSGPDSVDYLDRLAIPFDVRCDGHWQRVRPFSGRQRVRFGAAGRYTTGLFDSPDRLTLPALTGAASVAVRIGFDDALANGLLSGMIRSGLWRAISGSAFRGLRRRLLYNPGTGDHHRVSLRLTGRDAAGELCERALMIDDPAGQTHLTAVGALVQVERVLGLQGHAAAPAGVQFAEALTDGALLRKTLQACAVQVHDAQAPPTPGGAAGMPTEGPRSAGRP